LFRGLAILLGVFVAVASVPLIISGIPYAGMSDSL
jgi:hypothetical protein